MRQPQLRAFHNVARELSVTRAAAKLGQTQPALSIQLRNLEKDYGVKLFDRTPNGLRLTSDGAKLQELTRDYLKLDAAIEEFLLSSGQHFRGKLRLVADDHQAALTLTSQFQDRHPGVDISLDHSNSLLACQALREEKVDLAIITDPGQQDSIGPGFIKLPLWRNGLSVLLPQDHDLCSKEAVYSRDLADYPCIHREEGSLTRQVIMQLLAEQDIDLPVRLTVTGREPLREAIAKGNGIGYIADHEHGYDARLVALPLVDARAMLQTSLIYLPSQRERPMIEDFIAMTRQARQQPPFGLPQGTGQIE